MPTSDSERRAGGVRALGCCLLAGAAFVLAACLQAGESGLEAELARVRAIKDIGVVSATPERAVLAARNRRVVIEPAPGSCIAEDSIEISRRLAFLVVADCMVEFDASGAEIELPPAFPGVVTVSVSDSPMDERATSRSDAIRRLQAFLQTPQGHEQLGRGGDSDQVEIEEMRVVGDTLYVHVLDADASAMPILSREFWRAFAEVNDRMILATVSGFSDNPMDSDTMLRKLVSQISAIRVANGADPGEAIRRELPVVPPPEREAVPVASGRSSSADAPAASRAVLPRPAPAVSAGRHAPTQAPLASGRPGPTA